MDETSASGKAKETASNHHKKSFKVKSIKQRSGVKLTSKNVQKDLSDTKPELLRKRKKKVESKIEKPDKLQNEEQSTNVPDTQSNYYEYYTWLIDRMPDQNELRPSVYFAFLVVAVLLSYFYRSLLIIVWRLLSEVMADPLEHYILALVGLPIIIVALYALLGRIIGILRPINPLYKPAPSGLTGKSGKESVVTEKVVNISVADAVCKKVQENEKITSLSFKSCEFPDDSLSYMCRQLESILAQRKVKLLEISNCKSMNESHAQSIASFLSKVHVEVLDVHGSNMKQFISSIFKPALMKIPKDFSTKIVFEKDEVQITVDQNGGSTLFGHSGCSINIPKGALNSKTKITLMVVPELTKLPGNLIQVTPIIRCLPTGLTFNKHVTMKLSTWCRPLVDELNLTVFSRENEEESWKEEQQLPFNPNNGFIEFQTDHFSDDVVGVSREADEIELIYQVKYFQKKYIHIEDDQIVKTYCFPSNYDFLNDITINTQSSQLVESASVYPIRVKPNQTISIEILQINDGIEIEDPCKEFKCGCNQTASYHISIITSEAPFDQKKKGFRVKSCVKINDADILTEKFKILWKPFPENSLTNIVAIRKYVEKQTNITRSRIERIEC